MSLQTLERVAIGAIGVLGAALPYFLGLNLPLSLGIGALSCVGARCLLRYLNAY